MSDKPKDHGEPPTFAKWLIWLFRKDTWTGQPVIAAVATIIVISVAVSAVYGVYSVFLPDRGDDVAAATAVSDVAVEPEKKVVQQPPIRLSAGVALPQTGPTGTLMSFSIDYQFSQGGPEPTATYVWIVERLRVIPFSNPSS